MADINKKEPKDSIVNVSVLPNNTEAYIFVIPPENGGKPVTKDMIMSELQKNKVVYGLREDVIDSIVSDSRYNEKFCIASATYPIDGENGTIKYRYSKETNNTPVENEFGFVDYKNLGIVRMVNAGDVIADITLPKTGEPGTDIHGGIMRQIPGKKASYTLGVNTKLTDDGTQIVAAVDGHIIYKNGTFNVECVVTISGDVDASVGNIDFTGDVIIKGSVCEGFKVSSNANIVVSGDVNGAVLESGGDIVIKKGCINSKITSHGSVSALFCERSNIKCDGNIAAQNYVICDVYCGGTLITRGTNGSLIGGRYVILNSIETSNIGSKNYIQTEITLGDNALLSAEKNNLLAKIAKLEKETADLALIVNFLNEKKKELHGLPDDKEVILGNAARQKIINGVEIGNANKRIKEIDISLANRQMLSVSCKGYIYPGTSITINDTVFKADIEYVHSKVFLSSDGKMTVATV